MLLGIKMVDKGGKRTTAPFVVGAMRGELMGVTSGVVGPEAVEGGVGNCCCADR
jgi:hypothetical protein